MSGTTCRSSTPRNGMSCWTIWKQPILRVCRSAAGKIHFSIDEFSASDATRLRTGGQSFPKQMIFWRCSENWIALTAVAPVALRLCEQGANFRLAAGGQQCQPVERADQSALRDEFATALAEPTGQLQAWIFELAHIGQALTWCAFR